ncbi:hypothetical protein M758_5G099900, partial [Ceratodon purpureus]
MGAELVSDWDGIWIHQRRYIREIYGMENYNPLKVPMSTSTHLRKDMEMKPTDAFLFKSICGSFIYVCNTRFDISYSVSCRSKRQPNVALSTTEEEYKVMCEATRDIVYMRRLMFELQVIEEGPTPLLCDNQSSIRLVNNPVLHEKTKHVKIYYHFVREKSAEGEINVSYISTSIQQANIYTKPRTAYKHACMREEASLLQL